MKTFERLKDLDNNLYKNRINYLLQKNKVDISDSEYQNLKKNFNKFSYVINLLATSVKKGVTKKDSFLNELTDEINSVTDINITKLQVYNLLESIIKNKEHFDVFYISNSDFENIPNDYKYKIIQDNSQQGGFFGSLLGWDEETGTFTKFLDIIDLMLDLAGFIPGAGIPVDIVGILFSLLRGNFMEAFFSAINVIPLVGSFIGTPMKYIRRYRKAIKNVKKMKKLKEKAEMVSDFVSDDNSEAEEDTTEDETEEE